MVYNEYSVSASKHDVVTDHPDLDILWKTEIKGGLYSWQKTNQETVTAFGEVVCSSNTAHTYCAANNTKNRMQVKGVRYQCGQPSVNLRQVPGQSNGQWCEIGKRGK